MNMKFIGGVLLIVGTSIGGGMLALPVTTAQGGFLGSILLLIASWFLMTVGGFIILEVNLWFPTGNNLGSMAHKTLGNMGRAICWLTYLLLLYSLVAAYISGGADVLYGLLKNVGIRFPTRVNEVIFLIIFGYIVYLGVRMVDYVNRGFMTVKFITLLLLFILIIPKVNYTWLAQFHTRHLVSAITIVIASFGFSTIIPTLRMYFNSDIKKLRLAIIIGSMIPLVSYIFWVAAILGEIPLQGPHGLIHMLTSEHPTTSLVMALHYYLINGWVKSIAQTFTTICIATSFLGVSLALSDFMADGLGLRKKGLAQIWIYAATFLPPLLIVLLYPAAFLICLNYAGIFCVILLALLPAMMAWRGRKIYGNTAVYRLTGGNFLLALIVLLSVAVIVFELLLDWDLL